MKQVILIQLLASLTAGGSIARRQQDGVDATALGQSWIQKMEDFAIADKNVTPEVKNALISSMSDCSLQTVELADNNGVPGYRADCPYIIDVKHDIVAVDATALGEAWIAAARGALDRHESPQSGQNAINSITKCSVGRSPVVDFTAGSFEISCPQTDSDAGSKLKEEAERLDAERKEAERKDAERKEAEKKDEGNSPIEDPGSLPTEDEDNSPTEDPGSLPTENEDNSPTEDPGSLPTEDNPTTSPSQGKEEEKVAECSAHEDCEGDLKCFEGDLIGDPNRCRLLGEGSFGKPVTPLP